MISLRLRWLALVLLLLGVPLLAPAAKVRLGGVSVGVGYSRGFYPYCGYFYPGVWCDPFLYSYFYFPSAFYPGVYSASPRAGMGQVKLQTPYKQAEVYLNGAYAGTVGDLKQKIWLEPGVYELEIRPEKVEPLQKRIYVLSGKTVKIKFGEVRR